MPVPKEILVGMSDSVVALVRLKAALVQLIAATGSQRASQSLAEVEEALKRLRQARGVLESGASGVFSKSEPPKE